VAERHRPRYAALIVGACRAEDREVRRSAFPSLGGWARWAGDLTELVVGRLVDLGVRTAGAEVADLLRATGGRGLDLAFDRLAGPIEPWRGEPEQGEPERGEPGRGEPERGEPERGEPERRRIELLADGAAKWTRAAPLDADRAGPVAAARQLAARPSFAGTALRLLVALGRLDNLDELADRCAGRPLLAVRTAALVSARMRELPYGIDAAFLHPKAWRLAGRGDLAGGLFAIELTRPGATAGWSEPWRDLLLHLREHPDPDVREEAYAVDLT